jgi:Carboxypeptidase regulatory-like domain/TonB dependent receptor
MTSRVLSTCEAILVLAGILACFFLPAHAQTESGTIRGAVTDPSGALVPGASVRLIDDDRGLQTEVASGNGGFYTFSTVRPGHYRMEVEKNGFKLAVVTGITLNVLDNLVQNFRLDVGPVSDSITVKANALNVNTTDGTVSTVVDRTFADNLPLNGRSFQTLIMLTPGVVVTPTAFDDQGQFSVNGQRADANYFTVDGVSANFGVTGYFPLVQSAGGALPALSVSGGTNSLVSVDAIREFRVQTSSFAPEFGRTPGGQVSIVTRSGTNDFHGTLFEYFRNDVLDANDWFNGYTNNPPLRKAEERQNDFGGVFGGPVIKNKTFFFFSYEGLRLRQPSTQQTVVPDNASRQQAPATMQPFLNAYPVANGAARGNGLAQFNASYSDPSSLNAYSIRVDQAVNSKINLFARYDYSPSSLDQRGAFPPPYMVLSATESVASSVQTFTLGMNQIIAPPLSNEVRVNYSNQRLGTKYFLDNFGGAAPLPDSVLFPSGFSSTNSLFLQFVPGVGEYGQGKSATDEQRQINFIDNLLLTIRSHQLKFGVDYRWLSPFSSPFNYQQFVEFSGIACPPSPPCGGYALSGTVPGNTTTVFFAQSTSSVPNALVSQNFSVYGQDTWKITPRVTVTYGLRWEINPPLKGKNSANDPFTVVGLNNPATMTLAPRGTPLYQTTFGNIAPRFGIAYQAADKPKWEAVFRAGFGVFYDLGQGSLGGVSSYFPYNISNNFILVPFPLSPQNAAPPALTTNPPVNTINVADPHLKLPHTYEWNGAVEQSLGNAQSLSLTYVGAIGRHLLRVVNLLSPNPNFNFVGVTDNSATSDYHALQVKFQRRFSRGLQGLASYTWSHSIDIGSTDAFANYLNTPSFIANPSIDRGNSDFDIRHAFTAGVTYNLPSPAWNSFVHAALGGWSVDSFVLARSAPPVNVIGGYSFAAGTAIRYRPDVVPDVPLELFGSQYPGGKIFNSAAFTTPPSGQQGDFGRNVLRGFGVFQADFAIQRQFRLTERVGLRFRGEFFNIFNHPNFGPPIGDLTSSQFGFSTQTLASSLGSGGPNGGFNPLYQIGGPRSIQLALELQF